VARSTAPKPRRARGWPSRALRGQAIRKDGRFGRTHDSPTAWRRTDSAFPWERSRWSTGLPLPARASWNRSAFDEDTVLPRVRTRISPSPSAEMAVVASSCAHHFFIVAAARARGEFAANPEQTRRDVALRDAVTARFLATWSIACPATSDPDQGRIRDWIPRGFSSRGKAKRSETPAQMRVLQPPLVPALVVRRLLGAR